MALRPEAAYEQGFAKLKPSKRKTKNRRCAYEYCTYSY